MYLTAEEAARELGVSVTTLYAYVSRKQIRTQKAPGARTRRYWREDIERLKGASASGAEDVLAPRSAITLITEEGHFYRGRSALALAERETLESVCALLWDAPYEATFGAFNLRLGDLYHRTEAALAGAPVQERAVALLPLLERSNPRAFDLTHAGYARTGAELMRWFGHLIGGFDPSDDRPLHQAVAGGLGAPPPYEDILRRLFVLAADHELDPSTYAVRAIANTGVTAHQAVLVGLASTFGRRLMFGRAQSLERLMDEVLTTADPESAILRPIREGASLPGFGSGQYPAGDPRARALLAKLEDCVGEDVGFRRLQAAIRVARDATGLEPALAIPLSFVAHKLGLKGQGGVIWQLPRMAGWIAHTMEQYLTQETVRPRTVYTGPLPG
ncbi:citrate/2-methylcitrate synthase [Phenylobacterium terrae]|uniref:citrate/2-methylcitrate synthase n=1 Tax=Phenylobacterium terrae TaxID=2665495 RepID=UPI00366B7036